MTPKPTALIVDDEEGIRALLKLCLENYFPQFNVEEAGNGHEAAEKIKNSVPQLILLDLRIPGYDGVEICRQIRSSPALSKTVLLIISGLSDDLVKDTLLYIGANEFIQKPFDLMFLQARIAAHLKKLEDEQAA